MTSNKTLNLIKYYAVDSVSAVVSTNEPEHTDAIVKALSSGMNTMDNLLNRPIYYQLEELDIKQSVEVNPTDFNCDLLIIDSNSLSFIETKLQESLNKKIDIIFVNKVDGLCLSQPIGWEITEEEGCFILEYKPKEYENNSHKNIYHFYELIAGVHDILDNANVEYFLIKSSCLGAVRNRNHIVYSDCINIGCPLKDEDLIKKLFKDHKYFRYGNDKIHLTEEVYIKISFDPDVTKEELGNRKIYSYGPIKAYSLEKPIPYLKRIYGDKVFKQLVSRRLSEPIKSPKRLYDCYYNTWAPYTSRYCKKQWAKNLKQKTDKLTSQGVKWWIESGTILGAVRNGRIALFEDDTDIGIFKQCAICNSSGNVGIEYITNFNAFRFYAGKLHKHVNQIEEINYMFAVGKLTGTEFKIYQKVGDKYISNKDDGVSAAHRVPNLKNERAIDEKWLDDELDEIVLEGYVFKCPHNPYGYVTLKARYGKESVNGDPIRNGKPGGHVLRDDFY